MTGQNYQPPHTQARLARVKEIWREEWEKKQAESVSPISKMIPVMVSFSFGYLDRGLGHGVWFWLFTMAMYIATYYFVHYVGVAWKIVK